MKIWLKIRIQRAKITMGTIFGPFISILSQKNILGQNMKNCRIFFDTLCIIYRLCHHQPYLWFEGAVPKLPDISQ